MIWNEPNNTSQWDPELAPDFARFAEMTVLAGQAVARAGPGLTRALGGMSPVDPGFMRNMDARGVLDAVDVVALHGFPLDWNLWPIDAWPDRLAEIRALLPDHPVWVSEVGVVSFGADEVQVLGWTGPPRCFSTASTGSTGIPSSTCRRTGAPPPATARRKGRANTGISAWA